MYYIYFTIHIAHCSIVSDNKLQHLGVPNSVNIGIVILTLFDSPKTIVKCYTNDFDLENK